MHGAGAQMFPIWGCARRGNLLSGRAASVYKALHISDLKNLRGGKFVSGLLATCAFMRAPARCDSNKHECRPTLRQGGSFIDLSTCSTRTVSGEIASRDSLVPANQEIQRLCIPTPHQRETKAV